MTVASRGDACVFCAILRRETPAEIVLEGTHTLAFLDARPVFRGHVLLVPRDHHETLVDLPNDLVAPLFSDAQKIARALERALGADGTFVAMNNRVSQSVPHLHVHVVPRKKGDGLKGFFWPRVKYREGEMAAVADEIRAVLRASPGR